MAIVADQPSTRPSLLIRLRDPGDEAAWNQFVDLYGPILFRYCRRRGLQESDAGEVMQEVLLQVSRSIRSFRYDRDRGQFRGWLTTILKSKLAGFWKKLDHDRSHNQSQPLGDVAGGGDSDWNELCQQRVMDVALEELKKRLSAEHWQSFEAVWLKQQSPANVAERFGKDVTWVYLVKSRGLSTLRDIVERISADVPWLNCEGNGSCDAP
jgi:RNA polymerase sigma factor (sigma-70 family)